MNQHFAHTKENSIKRLSDIQQIENVIGEKIDLKRYVDFSKEFCKLNPQVDEPYDEEMSYSRESITFLTDNIQEVIDLITYSYFIFNAELNRRHRRNSIDDDFYETLEIAQDESMHQMTYNTTHKEKNEKTKTKNIK